MPRHGWGASQTDRPARRRHGSPGVGGWRWLSLVFAMCLVSPLATQAHSLTIAVLAIKQVHEDQFIASWDKAPGTVDADTAYRMFQPIFPQHCAFEPPQLDCRGGGLFGELGFAGLGGLASSGVVNVEWNAAEPQSYSFSPDQPTVHVSGAEGSHQRWRQIARNFTGLGFEHILLGWDHLLFVLGLSWLVRTPIGLLRTITGFTVAHSMTLTAATLGWTRVPVPPVEAVIALSIVFVAVEAIKQHRGGPKGLTARFPWLVAFCFGLLHGFGFASALSEVALAQSSIPLSLLFFNVGVELGQLTFVAVVWPLRLGLNRYFPQFTARAAPVIYYATGTLAAFWVIERISQFWS
ncbi:MAG: HupE/UreJ family protein [Myxococcales bacterium FL481]|nr:MAG: HupE/UreJ family protein [Myxococcales bacterium FL481]